MYRITVSDSILQGPIREYGFMTAARIGFSHEICVIDEMNFIRCRLWLPLGTACNSSVVVMHANYRSVTLETFLLGEENSGLPFWI